jgi:hypothetical protein
VWLENKLALAAPNRSLAASEALLHVRELARTLATLSRGTGALYGTSLTSDKLVEFTPLIPSVTAQLATWGEVLEERHPGEGTGAFARLCREEGLEPPRPLPAPPEPARAAPVEAFCAAPGDRRLLRALADALVAAQDPIGAHLLRALALEEAPPTEESTLLAQAGQEFQKANRQSLVRLLWPVALQDFAMSDHVVYFERGLPTQLHLAAKDLGRFSRAQWALAPVSAIHVTLVGNETLDADFVSHPLFAKATSLSIGFMARPTLDLGPLLARPGFDLESVHLAWTGKALRQLAKLPSPAALTRLSLGCPVEGKKPVLTAQHIEGLAALFPSLRRLELSRLVTLAPEALQALTTTGWPADVLDAGGS